MDQKKIGGFLKELRKEKGMTQEHFAEILGVSGRTVSRWETGFNMPDLDVLIQIANYYNVELKEILDGEREGKIMNKETQETILKVADYSNHEKQKLTKRICILFVIGFIAFTAYLFMEFNGIADTFTDGMIAGCCLGFAYGMMIIGVLYTSGYLAKFHAFKKKLLNHH